MSDLVRCAGHPTWEIVRPEMKAPDSREDLHLSLSVLCGLMFPDYQRVTILGIQE